MSDPRIASLFGKGKGYALFCEKSALALDICMDAFRVTQTRKETSTARDGVVRFVSYSIQGDRGESVHVILTRDMEEGTFLISVYEYAAWASRRIRNAIRN